jgi:UDP-GlcNAc3NAcA epimerase
MPAITIVSLVGARPQFVKAAMVSMAAKRAGRRVKEVLVHSGQHYDRNMSQVFFEELALPKPDHYLNVGSGSHARQTGMILDRMEQVLIKEKPDFTIVYGDTNTTLAGALAASKLHFKLAHVESGLRSYNKNMPEEINRVVTDHVADVLFCPTKKSVRNLKSEGIVENVFNVGDVMYDSVVHYGKISETKSAILKTLGLESKAYYLATVHRAENTDSLSRLESILKALNSLKASVVFPVHPRTRKIITEHKMKAGNVRMISPVSYLDMIQLEKHASVILTDSGGVQKEAFFFGVPCVTLRDETEWVETVESGMNVLAGSDTKRIVASCSRQSRRKRNLPGKFYGDGKSADKIIKVLLSL